MSQTASINCPLELDNSTDRRQEGVVEVDMQAVIRALYEPIYQTFGGHDIWISIIGSNVLLMLAFWGFSLPLLYTDLTGKPAWLYKYKVQQDRETYIDRKKVWKAVKVVAFNNIVLNWLSAYPLYLAQARIGTGFRPEDTPTVMILIRDLAAYVVIQEVVFYYSHRLFHIPAIYKRVHKLHHEWTAPIGLICIYATPIEYMTGNGMSVFLGPIVMRSHITSAWIWYTLAFFFTVIHHSGYHIPFLPSPQFHDYHHMTFNWNFGTIGVLDWLHDTDRKFRESVQSKRHRYLQDLRPMHVLFPDPNGKAENVSNGSSGTKNE